MLFPLVLLVSASVAQEPVVACRACANHGAIDCSKHGKAMLPQEQRVEFCSEAAACRTCAGVLRVDCRQCRNPDVEAELERRRELVQAFRQERRTRIDDLSKGQPLLHLRSAHVDLAYGVRPLTVGTEKLDTHAGMHLYADRIEQLREQFLALFGAESRAQPARLQVLMCRDQQSHQTLSPHFTGISGSGSTGTKQMGVDAVYCMWHDLRSMPDDDALHRNIVHNVTHLLLANLAPAAWIGNRGHGWVDEGLAHWFEDRITGKCTNFCYEEVLLQPGAGFKGGRWRVPVRRLVDAGDLLSFPELSTKNTDQLEFRDHAHAFALVDHLLAVHGGRKFAAFVVLLKQGRPTREALQQTYATNPLVLDEDFKAWVKANYPLQESR